MYYVCNQSLNQSLFMASLHIQYYPERWVKEFEISPLQGNITSFGIDFIVDLSVLPVKLASLGIQSTG